MWAIFGGVSTGHKSDIKSRKSLDHLILIAFRKYEANSLVPL